ncbi:hypothetical protein DXV76_20450 [Rhodobacteraceae bacterium CCMM004]|nr:hypothetical protein DXV76_20450 [Rhodobacteraceae bacterium CCMM004]
MHGVGGSTGDPGRPRFFHRRPAEAGGGDRGPVAQPRLTFPAGKVLPPRGPSFPPCRAGGSLARFHYANKCAQMTRPRLGLVVNPLAGIGGPAGLNGSDDAAAIQRAIAAGARPQATERAARAMAAFRRESDASVVTGPGALGADAANCADIVPHFITGTAEDTRALVAAMQDRVDLILFCGGDGTARDVAAANQAGVPILGVPAGVKMHSGIFSRTPERAGQGAAAFLAAPQHPTELVEILDIDEAARARGRLSAEVHTVARAPLLQTALQGPKSAGNSAVGDLDAALARYVAEMQPGVTYVIGPGTTMAALKDRLGGGTLLGVDAARNGRIVGRNLDRAGIETLATAGAVRIALGVVGGQGFLLGRGNQQIGPATLRRVGRDAIDVFCTPAKLAALPRGLCVDTGEAALDAEFAGYMQIATGPGRRQVVRVGS